MSTAAEIERAIEQLPPEELARLRAWFAEFDAARWDRQFEDDAASGRLNKLADEALTDADKHALDAALTAYEKSPNAGSTWDEVKARIQSKLRP